MKSQISCRFELAIDTLHPLPSISWTPSSKLDISEKHHEEDSVALSKSTDTIGCVANLPIAQAINKLIMTTPSLRYRSTAPPPAFCTAEPPDDRETLEAYIRRVLNMCDMPIIVPYTSLYLLMTISRSCTCTAISDTSGIEDEFSESPKPRSLAFSHYLSRAFTRSPLSRVRKSHWVGHHFFLGAFLLAVRSYERISGSADALGYGLLSVITGVSMRDLRELESSIYDAMGDNLKSTINEMIEKNQFRTLVDIECPHTLARRRRDAEQDSGLKMDKTEKHRIRRLFSSKRKEESQSDELTDDCNVFQL